jgi:hypothetical protein
MELWKLLKRRINSYKLHRFRGGGGGVTTDYGFVVKDPIWIRVDRF